MSRKIKHWRQKLLAKQVNTLPEKHFQVVKSKLAEILGGVFGYYSLLYSQTAKALVGKNLIVRQSLVLSDNPSEGEICCRYEALPIASDTIDLVVLPEILKNSSSPHQLLREVERVLIPEGTAIVIITNPFSWLNFRNWSLSILSKQTIKTKVVSKLRICDWFRLLGFEVTDEIPICSNLPDSTLGKNPTLISKIKQLSCEYFASYYIIVAKKKVSTLTPIRPSWRKNRKLVRPRIAEPTVNSQVDDCVRQITK